MDVSTTQIKRYLEKFKPELKEGIANLICDGEAFVNSFDAPSVKIVLEVISKQAHREIDQILALIREGKFNEDEEIRRIRQHCIGLNTILDIIVVWNSNLETLNRHLEKME
uniref:Uncharacterized protein n=1 Tax=viral metagenome TaxID=1070528 RepID=A0A6M3LQE7_9ZZZZ